MALKAMSVAKAMGLYAKTSDVQPEGATQTFLKGALLLNSAGNLIVAAADPAVNTLVGLAAEDGHNAAAAAKSVRFYPLLPHYVFEATLAGAAGAAYTLTAADRWGRYGIGLASNIFFLDQSDTVNVRAVIVGFRDGLINHARVYFVFMANATVYTNT